MSRRRYNDDRERITRNVRVDESGCWRWLLMTTSQGYGHISVRSQTRITHRFAYETFVGPIPEGLTLDHLCRVRDCVNPAHLEPVPLAENLRRSPDTLGAGNARRTHCLRGHPYDDENTYVLASRPTVRYCRACNRELRAAARAVA